jgi:hypothetical protein
MVSASQTCTANTLGRLALTRFSIGNQTAGNRAFTKAEEAYQAILRYSPKIQMNTNDSTSFMKR